MDPTPFGHRRQVSEPVRTVGVLILGSKAKFALVQEPLHRRTTIYGFSHNPNFIYRWTMYVVLRSDFQDPVAFCSAKYIVGFIWTRQNNFLSLLSVDEIILLLFSGPPLLWLLVLPRETDAAAFLSNYFWKLVRYIVKLGIAGTVHVWSFRTIVFSEAFWRIIPFHFPDSRAQVKIRDVLPSASENSRRSSKRSWEAWKYCWRTLKASVLPAKSLVARYSYTFRA